MVRPALFLVAAIAACGDGNPAKPDAAVDASIDSPPIYPACREFIGPGTAVPARITGSLTAPDVVSPTNCGIVDAPYGVESAGPDAVVKIDGLVAGTPYMVKLTSTSDLAFYVATSCSTATGPSGGATGECALFVDASAGTRELGRFVATTQSAYVVVDYWGSSTPSNQSFALDIYAEACTTNAQCIGATPVCDAGKCVQCATSFDCTSAQSPRCDGTTNMCIAGVDSCAPDDPSEPADDGPAGAVPIVLDGSGAASVDGQVCSSPRSEADFYSFAVTAVGETWDLGLAWTGMRDLDLEVFDPTGAEVGLSYWEEPEQIRLTHLPIGTYLVRVTDFSSTNSASVPYTLTAQRTAGAACSTRADCAAQFRNQVFRGDCVAGACFPIAGAGAVAQGGACDSVSDCSIGLLCPSFYFTSSADTRDVCAHTCTSDGACGDLGASYVCTTYLVTNMCVQKCTADDHCPTSVDTNPPSPPWYRLRCDLPTGRCVP